MYNPEAHKKHRDRNQLEYIMSLELDNDRSKWNTDKLLKYVFLLWEEVKGNRYLVIGNSIAKEKELIEKVLALLGDINETVACFDWYYHKKLKDIKFNHFFFIGHDEGILREYAEQRPPTLSFSKYKPEDPLPQELLQHCDSKFVQVASWVKTISDLVTLRDKCNLLLSEDGQVNAEWKRVISLAIKLGVLPKN